MKSSKDVPPRVGMQFVFNCGSRTGPLRRRIAKLDGDTIVTDVDDPIWPGTLADSELWMRGSYDIEWIPPTDDERRMFMAAARPKDFLHPESGSRVFGDCVAECDLCNDGWREIADSLALDGADYDNMPAGRR